MAFSPRLGCFHHPWAHTSSLGGPTIPSLLPLTRKVRLSQSPAQASRAELATAPLRTAKAVKLRNRQNRNHVTKALRKLLVCVCVCVCCFQTPSCLPSLLTQSPLSLQLQRLIIDGVPIPHSASPRPPRRFTPGGSLPKSFGQKLTSEGQWPE